MRDEFMRLLYENRHGLKGIALVQGLKALESLVEKEKTEPEAAEEIVPHSLLDQIHALPPAKAIELIDVELERLEEEIARHRGARTEMEGLL